MWTVILIIIGFLAFGLIRGTILNNRTYKVVNKNGTTFHIGTYLECKSMAKTQNDYCETFSIDDHFTVKQHKL